MVKPGSKRPKKIDTGVEIDFTNKSIYALQYTMKDMLEIYNILNDRFRETGHDFPLIVLSPSHYRLIDGWTLTIRGREPHHKLHLREDVFLPEGKDMIEFAPPEPETNICPLCGDTIPDDTLHSPNILCEKCHRPIACSRCKREVLEPVGITKCPWCKIEPESTERIKHALRVRKEKKTYEEEQQERYKFMTDYVTARIDQPMDIDLGQSMMTSQPYPPQEPYSHEYPHRDGPDLMAKKSGWGAPFDIDTEKSLISNVAKITKDKIVKDKMEHLKEEAQRATGRSTQRRLSAMNHLFDRVANAPFPDRKVLFIVSSQGMTKETERGFQELYTKYPNQYNSSYSVDQAFQEAFMDRIDIITIRSLMRGYHGYTLIVLDLIAPLQEGEAKRLKMNISPFGCPIIGGESIVEVPDKPIEGAAEEVTLAPYDTPKISWGDQEIKVSKSNITIKNDIVPVRSILGGNDTPAIFTRGPPKVSGTFEGVMKPNTLEDVSPLLDQEFRERKRADVPSGFLGYAVGPANKDGVIVVMQDTGKTVVRLVDTDKKFIPGNLVTVSDVYPPDHPKSTIMRRHPFSTVESALPKRRLPKPDKFDTSTPGDEDPIKWLLISIVLGIPIVLLLALLWTYLGV